MGLAQALCIPARGIGSGNRKPHRGTDGVSWGFGNAGFGSIRSAMTPITRVMWTTRITTRSTMGWSAVRVIGRNRPFIASCVWVFTPRTGPVAVSKTLAMNLASLRNEPRAHSRTLRLLRVLCGRPDWSESESGALLVPRFALRAGYGRVMRQQDFRCRIGL